MKHLLLALMLLAGCASFRGQVDYDGPTAKYPQVRIVRYDWPAPRSPWSQTWTTWHHEVRLVVDNPSTLLWTVDVDCNGSTMYRDVVLPARTSQYYMLGRDDVRCTVSWR